MNGTALTLFQKSVDNANNQKLIKAVLSSGHQSVMEHCSFNVAFNNVSVFVEQFIIEFRLASFTVQSRRYVDFSNVGFYTDPSLSEETATEYNDHIRKLFAAYGELLKLDIPKEDARFVLPYCFHSNFFCSCNSRELLHIICSMIYGRGSVFPEIETLGKQLAEQFEEYFPNEISKHAKEYSREKETALEWCESLRGRKHNAPAAVSASVAIVSHSSVSEKELLGLSGFNFASLGKDEECDISDILLSTRSRELEFINISYLINDISLSSITHLVRHRMQSVMVPCIGNAVYSDSYILPESIVSNEDALKIYTDAFENNYSFYDKMLEKGLSPVNSVYFALSGNTLNVMTCMNARELVHFFRLRLCNRAQWEIRQIAESMLDIAKGLYPVIFNRVGPSCVLRGTCPEGAKSCGKIKEILQSRNNQI